MDEQLVQQITEDVSKNPNYEIYHLRKYFGKTLDNKYLNLEFTDKYIDENGENWDTSGITDKELIEVLLNRIKTNKVCYDESRSIKINDNFRDLFINLLQTMLLVLK